MGPCQLWMTSVLGLPRSILRTVLGLDVIRAVERIYDLRGVCQCSEHHKTVWLPYPETFIKLGP